MPICTIDSPRLASRTDDRAGGTITSGSPAALSHRFCVAPMMDRTDRHCRYLFRLLSRRALLYTEMITAQALIHGDVARLLSFDPEEHPVGLQVGGSEPPEMAHAARLAQDFGYDEININVGCPSGRVSSGGFGACLMAEPGRVADCVSAMRMACALPVTVKTRIGIDEDEGFEPLARFVETVAAAGARTFIVHARKAWLSGLSPEQNRNIPPLRYELVHRLKQEFPGLEVVLNGGVTTLEHARVQLERVDGVMLGREVYRNPFMLRDVDRDFYGDTGPKPRRDEILRQYAAYAARQTKGGARMQTMTRHLAGLYLGEPGARRFRRFLSETAAHSTDASMIRQAAELAEAAAGGA